MAISVSGIDYDFLSPDAVHICKDAMQTPFDGCMTTYAEVRCIKKGAPSLTTGYTPVSISWGGGTWNGYAQAMKSAPADPDRYNEYTVTCMDAMGYLNNKVCKTGGVFTMASFAAKIAAETGVTVSVPESSAYFRIDHLMPDENDDGDYPSFGKILQELGRALGVVFCASTSSAASVVYVANNGVGGDLTPYYPGTQVSVNDSYSAVCGKWESSSDIPVEFDVKSTSHETGRKINFSNEGLNWHKYEDHYVIVTKGTISENWEATGAGYIGKVEYGSELDNPVRIKNPTVSQHFVAGFGRTKKPLPLYGRFAVNASIFVNPMYHATDQNKDVAMLWSGTRTEVASTNNSAIRIIAGSETIYPWGITVNETPDSGWMQVRYDFDLSSLPVTQLADIHIELNSVYLQEGEDEYPGGGRGWTFLSSIEIEIGDASIKDGKVIKVDAGSEGKSFKMDTSFFSANDGNDYYLPGVIFGATAKTQSVMSAMAARLGTMLAEKTAVMKSASVPAASSGIKSFDLDVSRGILTQTNFTS